MGEVFFWWRCLLGEVFYGAVCAYMCDHSNAEDDDGNGSSVGCRDVLQIHVECIHHPAQYPLFSSYQFIIANTACGGHDTGQETHYRKCTLYLTRHACYGFTKTVSRWGVWVLLLLMYAGLQRSGPPTRYHLHCTLGIVQHDAIHPPMHNILAILCSGCYPRLPARCVQVGTPWTCHCCGGCTQWS